MLIDIFVIFFSLYGPFEASFYEITFVRRALREDQDCSLVAASRDPLYFKLELTPNYRNSLLTGDGC